MTVIKKPRVLIVIGTLALGGAEKHLLTTLPALLDRYEISLYTTSHPGVLAPQFLQKGIRIVGADQEKSQTKNPLLRLFRLGVRFFKIIKHLHRQSYDIIHFFLPGAYLIGGVSAVLLQKKHLVMSRRSQNDYQKTHRIAAIIEKKLHPHMTYVLGNSKKVIEQLKAEGVTDQQVRLIYNGVVIPDRSTITRENARQQYGLSESALLLTIIANLFFYKGHADLLRALALIKHQLPDDWQLLCVGRDAGELTSLMALSESLGLSAHVQWLGQRFDISELIDAADIGLLVSHEEGFSNAVLEFMAMAKPMIVTDVGGNAEAILDGVCGIVVPAKNIEGMAGAILTVATDEGLQLQYGAAARKRAEALFSVEQCVSGYDKLYQDVLKG